MGLECQHCEAAIPEATWGAEEAVQDGLTDELVLHKFNPEDSVAVEKIDYYCNPECAAAEFGGKNAE